MVCRYLCKSCLEAFRAALGLRLADLPAADRNRLFGRYGNEFGGQWQNIATNMGDNPFALRDQMSGDLRFGPASYQALWYLDRVTQAGATVAALDRAMRDAGLVIFAEELSRLARAAGEAEGPALDRATPGENSENRPESAAGATNVSRAYVILPLTCNTDACLPRKANELPGCRNVLFANP